MAESVPAEASSATDAAAPTAPNAVAPTARFGEKTLRRTLAAFTYRDFRVQWFGACTSSVGTWTQTSAQNWMVLALTGSAFYVGFDAFLQQLPIMLFTLIGGVLADRQDRRRTLLASQYIQMTTAIILGLLAYLGVVKIWHILVLSFTTGLAQAFGGPAYQALIPSLVDHKDLPNAVALNSIQINVARVLGPLAFGATITAFAVWGFTETQGMAACFFINAVSFLVVIYTLMSLHVKHIPPATASKGMGVELKAGLNYVRHHDSLVALTVLAAVTTFLGFAMLQFLSVFAQAVFHAGPETYSEMLAFSGAGSIVGALIVAWLGRFKRMGVVALIVQVVYGLLLLAFSMSTVLWLSKLILFLTGLTMMIVFSTITSLVQLITPNEIRGRVMGIYMVAFRGGMPLGSLVSGYAASYVGVPIVFGINGALLALVAVYFLIRSHGIREA